MRGALTTCPSRSRGWVTSRRCEAVHDRAALEGLDGPVAGGVGPPGPGQARHQGTGHQDSHRAPTGPAPGRPPHRGGGAPDQPDEGEQGPEHRQRDGDDRQHPDRHPRDVATGPVDGQRVRLVPEAAPRGGEHPRQGQDHQHEREQQQRHDHQHPRCHDRARPRLQRRGPGVAPVAREQPAQGRPDPRVEVRAPPSGRRGRGSRRSAPSARAGAPSAAAGWRGSAGARPTGSRPTPRTSPRPRSR